MTKLYGNTQTRSVTMNHEAFDKFCTKKRKNFSAKMKHF